MSSIPSKARRQTGDLLRRRDFLVRSSAATIVGSISISLMQNQIAVADDKKAPKLRELKLAHFEKFVGEKFTISRTTKAYGKQTAVFTLTEAKHHKHKTDKGRPSGVRKSGFTVMFRAETGERLEDGIWRVEHPKLGGFELFLHKTIRDRERRRVFFVAVFN